jgi:adenylate cyclase
LIQSIIDWLDRGAPPAKLPNEVLLHLCRRLVAAGVPLFRVAVFVSTLHPNVAGRAFYWREDAEEVEVDEADHAFMATDEHLDSPLPVIRSSRREIRRRLADPDCPMDFPVLAELRAQGITDYLLVPLEFMSGEVHGASFSTRSPGGFTDDQLAALHRVLPPLTRVAEIYQLARKAGNILDAYLGHQAGAKVLAGQIRRGDSEDLHAVIWFCDLRDSTPLADAMSREAFLHLLNEYFECVLGPVLEGGGEVLRFIGDAALAIFPVGNNSSKACEKAVEAAREAIARMTRLNETRRTPLRFGIGLHLGSVLYGNIGTPTRIEFTVIGAAANEAARIESLCKALDTSLIVSESVVRQLPGQWRSLGSHALRGVGSEIELYTLP